MKPKLVIIGAGGHGKVVYDAAVQQGKYDVIGFVDNTLPVDAEIIDGKKVVASQEEFLANPTAGVSFIVAIGNNASREKIFKTLSSKIEAGVVVHPDASLAINVQPGAGSVLLARCVVNASATIGRNCIVNCFALVDHDAIVGDHCHIERGSLVGPSSKVKSLTTTGMGKSYPAFSDISS